MIILCTRNTIYVHQLALGVELFALTSLRFSHSCINPVSTRFTSLADSHEIQLIPFINQTRAR